MSARPWMPFYFGDYIGDTGHLSTLEHGAYLLLIAHYWQKGGLPCDDVQLARIVRLRPSHWLKVKPVLQAFFNSEWRHKRIEFELTEATRISMAGRTGGIASGEARRVAKSQHQANDRSTTVQRSGNDKATNSEALQLQPHSQEEKDKKDPSLRSAPTTLDLDFDVVGEPPEAKLFRIGKTLLISFGIAEKRTGPLIGQWLKEKPDPIGLLAAIQFTRDKNVADPVAYISALVHSTKGKSNGTNRQKLDAEIGELADEARRLEREAGISRPDAVVRSS